MRKSHACRVYQKVTVVLLIAGMGQVEKGCLYVKEICSGFSLLHSASSIKRSEVQALLCTQHDITTPHTGMMLIPPH